MSARNVTAQNVPPNWDVRRLKSICSLAYGDSLPDAERSNGEIPVYGSNGKIGTHVVSNTDGPSIVIGRKGSFGKVHFSEQPAFAIDTTYFVDRNYTQADLHWLFYLLASSGLDTVSRDSAIPGLNRDDAYRMACPYPPPEEQAAIVRYLDRADELINRYIGAKERLIALLEEQRQAVIHQAVTRGLDSDIQTKPGEIPWLENIPKHWDVRRLGQLATKFGSGVTPRGGAAVYRDTGVPFLRSQNVHFDGLRLDDVVRIPPNLHKSMSASHVQPHDVLLNITGASIGRVCTVPNDLGQGNVNQHVCIIRPNQERLLSRFLVAFLSTSGAQNDIRTEQTGASREGLTLQSIRDFRIPLPPISEQTQIVHRIDEATDDVYRAIASTSRQIDLTNEYRTRLIADVVTGQIDVRDAVI